MAACALCPLSLTVAGRNGRCHGTRAPEVVASWSAVRGDSAIQRGGCDLCSSSTRSSIFARSSALHMTSRGPGSGTSVAARGGRNVVCEVAVKVGDAQSSGEQDTTVGKIQPGAKIRVKVPVTVYHVLKSPNLNLEGLEGELKEVLGVYKGKPISANFPYKVAFTLELEGQAKPVKFFAHLRDDEFEVVE